MGVQCLRILWKGPMVESLVGWEHLSQDTGLAERPRKT